MVSYASDVKKELTSLPVHPEHAKAELAAFLRMNGVLSLHDHQFSLDITTENPAIARRIFSLIKTAYGIEPLLIVSKKMKLKKNYQYLVRLQKQVHEILTDLEIFDSNNGLITGIPEKIMSSEQRAMSYLRGAFLASGSVNNPETSRYHLEIYSLYEDHNQDLLKLMNNFFYLNAKETRRRSGYIVYLKEAEKIGDFLRIINASNAVMYYEDIRIYRDHKNMTNRLNNMEQANVDKIINTALKQVDDINIILNNGGLGLLDEKEQIVAQYRLKYNEASLLELSEIISYETNNPISKSGVNHRMKKIQNLANRIREKESN